MNADYFKRSIPERYRILGLRLKPLSIGRYRLLERAEVAFVSSGASNATAGDLILGLLICAQRCDEFLNWVQSPELVKDVRRWERKVIPPRWCFWRRVPDLIEKMQLFRSYIKHHSDWPKYWDLSDDGGGGNAGHWLPGMEVTLRSQLGWTEEEINEQPLGKALADYFQYAQMQGAIRLMTEEEVQMGEQNGAVFANLGKESLN